MVEFGCRLLVRYAETARRDALTQRARLILSRPRRFLYDAQTADLDIIVETDKNLVWSKDQPK